MATTVTSRLTDDAGNVLFDFCSSDVRMKNFAFDGTPALDERSAEDATHPSLQQTITLLMTHATPALRRAARESLRRLLQQASIAIRDRISPNYVWWEHYEDGETAKRSLVFGGQLGHTANNRISGVVSDGEALLVDMVIERHVYFETVNSVSVIATANHDGDRVALLAGQTFDSRIERLALTADAAQGLGTISTAAVGIRPFNRGTSAFSPRLTIGKSVAINTLNNEYQSAPTTLQAAVASADYTHFVGRYRVFAELTLTAWNFGTIALATHGSFNFPSYMIRNEAVDVESGVDWVDLGELVIPLGGDGAGLTSDLIASQGFTFFVNCFDGTTGVTQLSIDALVLIPADSYIFSESLAYHSTVTQQFDTAPDDEQLVTSLAISATQIRRVADVDAHNWRVPLEGGVLVLWSPNSSNDCTVRLTTRPRFEVYG